MDKTLENLNHLLQNFDFCKIIYVPGNAITSKEFQSTRETISYVSTFKRLDTLLYLAKCAQFKAECAAKAKFKMRHKALLSFLSEHHCLIY